MVLMWTCPDCGSEFKNTNQWHSCGKWSVNDFLERKSDAGVALYHTFEKALLAMEGVDVRPAKTRILFRAPTAFASVEKIGRGFIEVTFGLHRSANHATLKRVFREPGEVLGHTARLASETDIESILPLLDESRATVGSGSPQG